jgi:hypothetical protein
MEHKYALEIYYPGSVNSVWVYFGSDTPFQSIHKGDILNPATFPDANADSILRVTSVEHILWTLQNKESKHKICVYTEDIENLEHARFGFNP